MVYRIYNDWAADFCKSNPERFRALACIPNPDPAEAASELRRASGLGLRGADFAVASATKPMYHEDWDVLWEAAEETQAPISFHTTGLATRLPDPEDAEEYERRYRAVRSQCSSYRGRSTWPASYSRGRATGTRGLDSCWARRGELATLRAGQDGPRVRGPFLPPEPIDEAAGVLAQAGFLHLPEGDHRSRHGAAYGRGNILWGSDYPHPDGVWPDSLAAIEENLAGVSAGARKKITCTNGRKLYGLSSSEGFVPPPESVR